MKKCLGQSFACSLIDYPLILFEVMPCAWSPGPQFHEALFFYVWSESLAPGYLPESSSLSVGDPTISTHWSQAYY